MNAILRAPLSETPESEEERAAFEAVLADIRAGRSIGTEEIAVTLAEMRRAQGE